MIYYNMASCDTLTHCDYDVGQYVEWTRQILQSENIDESCQYDIIISGDPDIENWRGPEGGGGYELVKKPLPNLSLYKTVAKKNKRKKRRQYGGVWSDLPREYALNILTFLICLIRKLIGSVDLAFYLIKLSFIITAGVLAYCFDIKVLTVLAGLVATVSCTSTASCIFGSACAAGMAPGFGVLGIIVLMIGSFTGYQYVRGQPITLKHYTELLYNAVAAKARDNFQKVLLVIGNYYSMVQAMNSTELANALLDFYCSKRNEIRSVLSTGIVKPTGYKRDAEIEQELYKILILRLFFGKIVEAPGGQSELALELSQKNEEIEREIKSTMDSVITKLEDYEDNTNLIREIENIIQNIPVPEIDPNLEQFSKSDHPKIPGPPLRSSRTKFTENRKKTLASRPTTQTNSKNKVLSAKKKQALASAVGLGGGTRKSCKSSRKPRNKRKTIRKNVSNTRKRTLNKKSKRSKKLRR